MEPVSLLKTKNPKRSRPFFGKETEGLRKGCFVLTKHIINKFVWDFWFGFL